MRTLKSLLALTSLAATLVIATASAQAAASATATATAEIIPPISISLAIGGGALQFGQIVPQTGGTVIIAPDSSRTFTGGVEVIPASLHTAAAFLVTGNAGNTFSISLPTSTTILNGPAFMTVDAFTSTPSGTGTLDVVGTKTLEVGGTLHVSAGQPVGHYAGTFNVSVAYN